MSLTNIVKETELLNLKHKNIKSWYQIHMPAHVYQNIVSIK